MDNSKMPAAKSEAANPRDDIDEEQMEFEKTAAEAKEQFSKDSTSVQIL